MFASTSHIQFTCAPLGAKFVPRSWIKQHPSSKHDNFVHKHEQQKSVPSMLGKRITAYCRPSELTALVEARGPCAVHRNTPPLRALRKATSETHRSSTNSSLVPHRANEESRQYRIVNADLQDRPNCDYTCLLVLT